MDYIKSNLSFLKEKYAYIAGAAFGVLSIFLSFVSWEDIGITSKYHKLLILAAVVVASFLLSVGWLCLKRKNKLWEEGEKRIHAIYGDLLKIKRKRISKKLL